MVKLIGIIFIFALAHLCSSASINVGISDEHNIDQCDETQMTNPVLQTNIYEPAALLSTRERTVSVPETGILAQAITCIRVLNEDSSAHGGYPKIVSGGIGSKSMEIVLTSQWNQPLNFRIEVYTG